MPGIDRSVETGTRVAVTNSVEHKPLPVVNERVIAG
jgi:hypothetical protein